MATSVHIPADLLAAVDRRARALKLSRNRLIVRALEREVAPGGDWTPGLFERLENPGPEISEAVDELMRVVRSARSSKGPPSL